MIISTLTVETAPRGKHVSKIGSKKDDYLVKNDMFLPVYPRMHQQSLKSLNDEYFGSTIIRL